MPGLLLLGEESRSSRQWRGYGEAVDHEHVQHHAWGVSGPPDPGARSQPMVLREKSREAKALFINAQGPNLDVPL